MRRLLLFLPILALVAACERSGPTGLSGVLLYGSEPLADASVEIYLKAEKDRSVQPFAVASTDGEGRYRLELPPGRYFIIGKKRQSSIDGRPVMLMAECPANPVQVEKGMLEVAPFALREMGRDGRLVPEPGTGLSGRVVHDGDGVAGAFVYVYTDDAVDLVGPSYGAVVETDDAGNFAIDLPSGTFWLAARRRADGSRLGELKPGDLTGTLGPVELKTGQRLNVGTLTVRPVDPVRYRQKRKEGRFADSGTALTGRVVDAEDRPVPGIYIFAYLDSRMVGKPVHISDPTGPDGRFRLNLATGGTYYLGARSAYGGPLEPGEWVGTWDGTADHHAVVETGQVEELGTIRVREVW
ncbi:hypothetical protein EDC39_11152 [Geothermobacter ehrlichii]|uniref:Carboxypeptidase family protein n=1 Tax=Geothermobacter ehrlichii TaxID=213224 RepID=A0A5D3WJX3_9BACT|nr:hypothetical protein [Geothermobacter ehrlichii]TYO97122.1 hypothetical protein EDC39_11152 [Geothermobacter ehrlichii]